MKIPPLKWRRTWPDKPDDFSCDAPDHLCVGRVYLKIEGDNVLWRWFFHAGVADKAAADTGTTKEQSLAEREIAQRWRALFEKGD